MDLFRNKPWVKAIAWGIAVIGLAMAGCQLTVPKNGWSKRKWGPLVPHTNFPGDCGICHLPDRWDKLRDDFHFDHKEETGYALEGAHSQASCLRCHNDRGPVQAYVSRGCGGCHLDPHAATLGMDCTRCHSQISWRPTGLIAEHARTRFPLVGAHAIATCESCHPGSAAGQFRGASVRCEVCHQADLAQATDPNHAANGWTSNCQECHQPSGWTGAFFAHNFFPLSGGHSGLDCSDCHVGGNYTGLSKDCYSCHRDDYLNTSNPNHVTSGFSTDCTRCHTVSGWGDANFNHTSFPLTGDHDLSCKSCHTTGTYPTFTCIQCHEHRQSEVDDEHDDVSGYRYTPENCYGCHPNGRE